MDPIKPFLHAVTDNLRDQVQAFHPDIASYAEYALTNQGKQFRSALVGLAGGATGSLHKDHLTVATIIEMVHLATLVHDDVMDASAIRRGRPTVASRWGNEITVLLGDCLFAHALKLAASFPTPAICRAVASATNTVCAGEILQTQKRYEFRLSREEYFQMLEMKTAELFALSCELGAQINNPSPSHLVAALKQFGTFLGTAYQVYDDCLDLFGAEATAGKSLGNDLANGKITLPVLIAYEKATPQDRKALQQLVKEWHPAALPRVLELLAGYGALTDSLQVIFQFLDKAAQSLEDLSPSPSLTSLKQMVAFLLYQTDHLKCHHSSGE